MSEEAREPSEIVFRIINFMLGVTSGWCLALWLIPNAEHYEIELQALKNDVYETKQTLAASRNRIEAQDYHLKWHDSRLDNHSERLRDLESLVVEEEAGGPEPLKFGQVN